MKSKTLGNTDWRQQKHDNGATARVGETIKTCHNPTLQWKGRRVRTHTVRPTQLRSRRKPPLTRTLIRRTLISKPLRSRSPLQAHPRKQEEHHRLSLNQKWKVHPKYVQHRRLKREDSPQNLPVPRSSTRVEHEDSKERSKQNRACNQQEEQSVSKKLMTGWRKEKDCSRNRKESTCPATNTYNTAIASGPKERVTTPQGETEQDGEQATVGGCTSEWTRHAPLARLHRLQRDTTSRRIRR